MSVMLREYWLSITKLDHGNVLGHHLVNTEKTKHKHESKHDGKNLTESQLKLNLRQRSGPHSGYNENIML